MCRSLSLLCVVFVALLGPPGLSADDAHSGQNVHPPDGAHGETHDEHAGHGHNGAEHDGAGHGDKHDEHGDEHGGEHHSAVNPNPLEIDLDLAFFTAALFGLLFWTMSKFAWGPILIGLKKREDRVAGDIAAAQASHVQAEELLAEYRGRLDQAGEEVRGIMDAAKKEAESMKQSIVDEAQQSAAARKDQATREIEEAKVAAIKELSGHRVGWAFRVASDAIHREVKPEDHQALLDEATT